MKMIKIILIFILITGCASTDYYQSKQYKIKQRKKESEEMFERMHDVRQKCSPRKRKHKHSKNAFYS